MGCAFSNLVALVGAWTGQLSTESGLSGNVALLWAAILVGGMHGGTMYHGITEAVRGARNLLDQMHRVWLGRPGSASVGLPRSCFERCIRQVPPCPSAVELGGGECHPRELDAIVWC